MQPLELAAPRWFIIGRLFGCRDRRAELRVGTQQTVGRIRETAERDVKPQPHGAGPGQDPVNRGDFVMPAFGQRTRPPRLRR